MDIKSGENYWYEIKNPERLIPKLLFYWTANCGIRFSNRFIEYLIRIMTSPR